MKKFDYKHYVPVLRWKQGEKKALKELDSEIKLKVTPLIELVPSEFNLRKIKKHNNLRNKLSDTIDQITEYWGDSPFFIDFTHFKFYRQENIRRIIGSFSEISQGQIKPIPVISFSSNIGFRQSIKSFLSVQNRELCLRINLEDINDSNLKSKIDDLLLYFNIKIENVHLFVDLHDNCSVKYKALLNQIPYINNWITFTISSGSMPTDLSEFSIGNHKLSRIDWLTWFKYVNNGSEQIRYPSFSDYTIRNAFYKELKGRVNTSASIRYTTNEFYFIMRGEWTGKKDGPGFAQYNGHAMILVEDNEYCGEEFSAGDKYIFQRSLKDSKTGNATTWIQATVNHHITFVVHQIANLTD